MKLFSECIVLTELHDLATSLGMELYEFDYLPGEQPRTRGKYVGHNAYKFTLRPLHNEQGDKVRKYTLSFEGKARKVWAVSWQGHYDFMNGLFNLDPNAVLVTSLATYDGLGGFLEKADRTGDLNIGSIMQPLAYADADISLVEMG